LFLYILFYDNPDEQVHLQVIYMCACQFKTFLQWKIKHQMNHVL